MTDHYGKIHNFDCLVGVLLNRVDEPMWVFNDFVPFILPPSLTTARPDTVYFVFSVR